LGAAICRLTVYGKKKAVGRGKRLGEFNTLGGKGEKKCGFTFALLRRSELARHKKIKQEPEERGGGRIERQNTKCVKKKEKKDTIPLAK